MRRIGCVIVATALLAGCGDDDDDTTDQERELSAELVGAPGFEQLSGEATVTWIEGRTGFTADIELSGDDPGQIRPWHVHFGTCETGGAIVGSDEDYSRLEIDDNGTASAVDVIPAPLTTGESYHVNVHLSETEMGTIIACGDLTDGDEL